MSCVNLIAGKYDLVEKKTWLHQMGKQIRQVKWGGGARRKPQLS